MLIHSEAKVEFFKNYLERYLRILNLAHSIDEINIFDVFCGTGIYDNGKKGSPIVAFDTIKKLREEYDFTKRINLIVNDSKGNKVSSVQTYIEDNNQNYCNVIYHNQPAEIMFNEVIELVGRQNRNSRNLIFIDPYGYKEIKKVTLQKLLENGRTEIILFLPISQMQRFTTTALDSDLKPYEPLKEFVFSFFEGDHPIKKQKVSAIDYINYLKDALRFGKYFSTSYYIERDESNYYALFFISHHIYGFEQILDVKWKLDEDDGGGFKQPIVQPTFFDQEEKQNKKNENYLKLEKILKEFLKVPRTNREVYEMILKNEFLPKHAAEIFRNWQGNSTFKVTIIDTEKPPRYGDFYINWEWYNPVKNSKPKVVFSL